MNFTDLQRRIKVSPATLRRDLTELEQAGEIIRVHGGVLDPAYVRSEISFDERVLRHGAAKRAIAAKAASLIPPGASVFVDAGSTCLEAGKALLGRKDVRVITHSVALISAAVHGEANVLCIGGELRKVSGALTGGEALGALERVQADFALVAASGMNAEGCFTTELSEAGIKQAFLKRATHKLLLADVTKWQQPSAIRFAAWDDFNGWIVDGGLPSKDAKSLKSRGMVIYTA